MGVTSFDWNLRMKWLGIGLGDYNLKFAVPTTLLILAGISSGLHLLRQMRCMSSSFIVWWRSWFNKGKYLSPVPDKYPDDPRLKQSIVPNGGPRAEEDTQDSFAIIYGASNNAGKAFALYLMERGFNLILIERDAESLQDLEDNLKIKCNR